MSLADSVVEQYDDPYRQYRALRGKLWGSFLAGVFGTIMFWFVFGFLDFGFEIRAAAVGITTLGFYAHWFYFVYPETRRRMREKKAEAADNQ